MKMVTFTTDMKPYHRGQDVPLPDALAAQVVSDGHAENPRQWPEVAVAEDPRDRRPRLTLKKGK